MSNKPGTSFLRVLSQAIGIAFLLLMSCEDRAKQELRVTQKYCSGCHLVPDPSLLDKHTWVTSVLPKMGVRLGLETGPAFEGNIFEDASAVLSTLPAAPMLTDSEFQLIVDYYTRLAPDSLSGAGKAIQGKIDLFQPEPWIIPEVLPAISMVRVDVANKKVYAGSRLNKVFKISNTGKLDSVLQTTSPVSAMYLGTSRYFAFMGIMDPNDQPRGSVGTLDRPAIIDSLKRPVDLRVLQLDQDADMEWVVSSFGNYTGDLQIWDRVGNEFKPVTLHKLPGTRMVIPEDVNKDGRTDLIALITQGDEQVRVFINEGGLRFSERILLRFPPVYGSSSIDIADMNGDGKFDIVHTSGDNADYSIVYKPYHGVRIYEQQDSLKFVEKYFYPLDGATQVASGDFDLDGDADMAVISYFPNFDQFPEQGFVYFENDAGKMIPQVAEFGALGRWLVMEKADLEGDGDLDLLLGALNFTTRVPQNLQNQWMDRRVAILVLRNQAKPYKLPKK